MSALMICLCYNIYARFVKTLTYALDIFDILDKLGLKISQLFFCMEVAFGSAYEAADVTAVHKNNKQRGEDAH